MRPANIDNTTGANLRAAQTRHRMRRSDPRAAQTRHRMRNSSRCSNATPHAQILALLTMERPTTMHPDDIRDEKTKVVRSMRVVTPADIVVGQYTAANGKPGYLDDDGVPADSKTATCAGVRIWCDNERWEGVPMIIRAGALLPSPSLPRGPRHGILPQRRTSQARLATRVPAVLCEHIPSL